MGPDVRSPPNCRLIATQSSRRWQPTTHAVSPPDDPMTKLSGRRGGLREYGPYSRGDSTCIALAGMDNGRFTDQLTAHRQSNVWHGSG